MEQKIKTLMTLRDVAAMEGSDHAAFFEDLRVTIVHVKLFLEMVQDPATAPSSEWVASRARELLA